MLFSFAERCCSLENCARVLRDCLLSNSAPLSPLISHHAASYITQKLLQHFNLYHFLLNDQQQESHTHLQMPVDTGEKHLPPLVGGLDEKEWAKRERVRQIEERHTLKQSHMKEDRQESIQQETKELETIEQTLTHTLQAKAPTGFREEEIQEMTTVLAEAKTRQFLGSLGYEMSQQEGSVGVRVESLAVQAEPQPGSSPPSSKKGKQSPRGKSPAASGRSSGRKS